LKNTKEAQDLKEELQRKEQIREAQRKKQEKLEDLEAKRRIKARIEADRLERKRRDEEARALREGRLPNTVQPNAPSPTASAAAAFASSGSSTATARLRLQTKNGNLVKTYPSETTLFEVAQSIEAEVGAPVEKFSTTFPRKVFEKVDFGQTLAEAGLTPSAVLVVN